MDPKHDDLMKSISTIRSQAAGLMFDHLPINYAWIDRDGICRDCNQRVLDIFELSDISEFIGHHVREFVDETTWQNSLQVMNQNKSLIKEEYHLPGTHKEIIYLSIKSPIHDKNQNVIGVLTIAVDITERKRMEHAVTENLTQLRTEFIQNMQHDIRTPISGIIGGISTIIDQLQQLLANTPSNEVKNMHELAILIAKATSQIHFFLNDAIDFDNIDYITRPVQNKKFELIKLAQSIIDTEALAAKAKGITLLLNIDPELPQVIKGDEYRLQRILLNLVSNAVKFTQQGMVELKVQLQKIEDKRILITFVVSDTGIGMPENKLDFIFEKFTRIAPVEQGLYEGNGLGLFRVKQFLDAIGGEIDVESELGKGTSFYLTIPFSKPLVNAIITTRFDNKQNTLQPTSQAVLANTQNMQLPIFDLEKTKQIISDDPQYIAELMQMTLITLTQEIATLKKAQRELEFKTACFSIHNLISICAYCTLPRFEHAIKTLQSAIKADGIPQTPTALFNEVYDQAALAEKILGSVKTSDKVVDFQL